MSTEKKQKLSEMIIGTHNGTFHCDEALACYMLKQLPKYKHAKIIRTRDEELLKKCDVIVDVGEIYNPKINRFDHHQKSFNETISTLSNGKYNWTMKLSSAGLIYAHYGIDVINNILSSKTGTIFNEEILVESIYKLIYENLIESIDAIDNGVNIYESQPRYKITTDLSSRVGHLNLPWNHPLNNDTDVTELQFEKALSLVGNELSEKIIFYLEVWWPARSLVYSAIKTRNQIDESGEIILLEKGGCPWKEHLFEAECSLDISSQIKYVIYSDSNNTWRIQCVPKNKNTFENRLSLPKGWRGLRDNELSKVAELDGCIFVHATGFIGGHRTKDGALDMARKSLKQT